MISLRSRLLKADSSPLSERRKFLKSAGEPASVMVKPRALQMARVSVTVSSLAHACCDFVRFHYS